VDAVWLVGGAVAVQMWWQAPSWALVARRRDQDVDARKRERAHHSRVEDKRQEQRPWY
jgi:hypothetical protein